MKILVIAPHAFYIDRGTPIDVDILLRAFSNRGDEVAAAVYHEGEGRDYPGLTIHRIKAYKFLDGMGPGFSPRKLIADLLLFFVAWRLVRRFKPDVIHAGEEAVFLAKFFRLFYRIPYVYDMDSSIAQQMVEKMGFLRPFAFVFNWFEARAIKGAVACAPVCHALADLAKKRGARDYETLHDISQLADPDRAATGFLREQLGTGDAPLLMYVGNFEAYQGVDLLLEAFAVAQKSGCKAHLVIAGGSDTDIGRYTQKAQVMGIDGATHFLGRWPANRLDELLAEADVLTAPRTRGLNTPMKIFPYMHSGRPVLVTDLPTHSQLLTQEVARLAPPDPEGFGQAIVELSEDADLRRRLGASGKAFVEANHTFEAHQRRVDRLYIRVAEQLEPTRSAQGAA